METFRWTTWDPWNLRFPWILLVQMRNLFILASRKMLRVTAKTSPEIHPLKRTLILPNICSYYFKLLSWAKIIYFFKWDTFIWFLVLSLNINSYCKSSWCRRGFCGHCCHSLCWITGSHDTKMQDQRLSCDMKMSCVASTSWVAEEKQVWKIPNENLISRNFLQIFQIIYKRNSVEVFTYLTTILENNILLQINWI